MKKSKNLSLCILPLAAILNCHLLIVFSFILLSVRQVLALLVRHERIFSLELAGVTKLLSAAYICIDLTLSYPLHKYLLLWLND